MRLESFVMFRILASAKNGVNCRVALTRFAGQDFQLNKLPFIAPYK
jgi:hypothetical protein